MYDDGNWVPVETEYLPHFLNRISPIDDKYRTSPETTRVEWRTLPFYNNTVLVRVHDPLFMPPELNIYFLSKHGYLFRLYGTAIPIHQVNADAPVSVTDKNVLDYLRFFCFFVRGESGDPFLLVEDKNNPDLPHLMDKTIRSIFARAAQPLICKGKSEYGSFMCNSVVFYSHALFLCDFEVWSNGFVEMMDDEPIAMNIPITVRAPLL